VNSSVYQNRSFKIDIPLADNATEGHLNVAGRTAEPVVKVQATEGDVEIVAPQEANHTLSKPKTFGISGWSARGLVHLDVFGDLAVDVSVAAGGAVGSHLPGSLGNCGIVGHAQEGHAEADGGNTHTTAVHILTY
jgi:hypothetical protein